MARPKVVVAAAALHPSIHTYPHPPSSVPSKEWSFGDPSRRDCGRVSFSPSLPLWPPYLVLFVALFAAFLIFLVFLLLPRIMLGIRPYCGEGLLCIFVADEGG